MLNFAQSAREYMAQDPDNVIAIHCKGGKGRTGTLVATWLIESGTFEEAKVCYNVYDLVMLKYCKDIFYALSLETGALSLSKF